MKVYRLNNDVNRYQYFLTEVKGEWRALWTDCSPRLASWTPPAVFIYEPLLKSGSLYSFSSETPIFTPYATEVLRDFLEMAGELLPLPFAGEVYTALNVTECINCLDHEHSEWLIPEIRPHGGVQRYVFHRDRFSESLLFKIPETHRGEVLVLDREDGEGFVDAIREHGLEGFDLQLLWTDTEG